MTDDPKVSERPAACWLDAFPWIEAATTSAYGGEQKRWWLEPVDAPGTAQRAERLAWLSGLAFEHLGRWTIGQIFPGLPGSMELARLPLSVRARNALIRFGYQTAGDLQEKELAELLDMRNVGTGTVDSILHVLADASTSDAVPLLLAAQDGDDGRRHLGDCDDRRPALRTGAYLEDLWLISRWHVAAGTPDRPLLGSQLAPGTPPQVVSARQRLDLIVGGDVFDQRRSGLDAAGLLQRCIGSMDARAQLILSRRLFANQPETLDELGQRFGVTRERVRQIESVARADLVGLLETDGMLDLVSAAARELVGTVLPLADLIEFMPALGRIVEAAGLPAWRVLDRLDDAYEIEDGWCASPTIAAAQMVTQTKLYELANQHGVVRIEDLDPLNPNQPQDTGRQSLRDWLAYSGYVIHGGYVFTRTQSVGDRAASILSATGAPMASQDILDRFDVERTLSSLKNALASDDRFERVDRDRWALAEWGLESYSGVRAKVREEVERGGGQVDLDTVVERITGQYSVTASSVVAYASAPPFETRDGVVRLASPGRGDASKSPARTRRLYRRDGAWLYRVKVTRDHLRGSGSPAPIAIAGILGLQYGLTCQLTSALGPQSISWTAIQPAFGTIRRFLVAADLAIDCEIFLVIGDDGSFSVEPVGTGGTGPVERALAMVGAVECAARRQPRVALAEAIGLPADSPAGSVIGGYRERGDGDVADLLLSARDELESGAAPRRAMPQADIDEILDLL